MVFHEGSQGSTRWFGGSSPRWFGERSPRRLLKAGVTVAVALVMAAPATAAPLNNAAQPGDTAQQPPIQARPGGPDSSPKSEQTVDVAKGTRLVVSNNAGEVVVRSWDRDQVRVQATHNERVTIDVTAADNTLRIRSRAARGPSGLVDYQLTVPQWMPVNLSGTYLESTIEGTTAEVTVESVHGNIRVAGGSGTVNVRSVQGIITVEKATGNVRATTVNEGIRLTNVSGDVYAETTNGDIEIEDAQTTSLEISTVNGDVTFNGSMRDGGSYRLTTHGGDVRVGLGGVNNATVFVRTFQGDFNADFPIQLPEGQSAREGSKRFNFTLGSGSARIELQTFNGDITLARKTIVSPQELRRQRRGAPPPTPKAPKPPGMQLANAWDAADAYSYDHEFDFDFDFDFHFDVHAAPDAFDPQTHWPHGGAMLETPHAPPAPPAPPVMAPPAPAPVPPPPPRLPPTL
jgi:DUF4097 and DUF4098 domain-containing protein YvlB